MNRLPKPWSRAWLAAPLIALIAVAPRMAWGAAYEFEGVGVKEVARGGASIADAEDWTSVYWNPAGLAAAAAKGRKEAGLDISGGIVNSRDSNSLSTPFGPIFSKSVISSSFFLGNAGAVIPINENLGIGFGFYMPLLQGLDFQESYNGSATSYKGSAGILTWNTSVGLRFSPKVSAGLGFDIIYGTLSQDWNLTVPAGTLAPLYLPDTMSGGLRGHGVGYEGVVGLRYDVVPEFSIGGVYRSGAHVPIKGTAWARSQTLSLNESSNFHLGFNHPPTAGVGIAWRIQERFTYSLDFVETYWSVFRNAVSYTTPGMLLADKANTLDWHDSYKIRTGLMAKASARTNLLFGYTFDHHALDPGSLDFSNSVDVSSHRFYTGVTHQWTRVLETSLGAVYGAGIRTANAVNYRTGGWQLRLGTRFLF